MTAVSGLRALATKRAVVEANRGGQPERAGGRRPQADQNHGVARRHAEGLQHARRVRGDAVGQGVDRVALPPAAEAPHPHPERRVPLEGALHRLADSLTRLAIARCS